MGVSNHEAKRQKVAGASVEKIKTKRAKEIKRRNNAKRCVNNTPKYDEKERNRVIRDPCRTVVLRGILPATCRPPLVDLVLAYGEQT